MVRQREFDEWEETCCDEPLAVCGASAAVGHFLTGSTIFGCLSGVLGSLLYFNINSTARGHQTREFYADQVREREGNVSVGLRWRGVRDDGSMDAWEARVRFLPRQDDDMARAREQVAASVQRR